MCVEPWYETGYFPTDRAGAWGISASPLAAQSTIPGPRNVVITFLHGGIVEETNVKVHKT